MQITSIDYQVMTYWLASSSVEISHGFQKPLFKPRFSTNQIKEPRHQKITDDDKMKEVMSRICTTTTKTSGKADMATNTILRSGTPGMESTHNQVKNGKNYLRPESCICGWKLQLGLPILRTAQNKHNCWVAISSSSFIIATSNLMTHYECNGCETTRATAQLLQT
jgi:hypothetical protein